MDPEAFRKELEGLLNRYSKENGANTPDFILANYLMQCLKAFEMATLSREDWYGVRLEPGKPYVPVVSVTTPDTIRRVEDGGV